MTTGDPGSMWLLPGCFTSLWLGQIETEVEKGIFVMMVEVVQLL